MAPRASAYALAVATGLARSNSAVSIQPKAKNQGPQLNAPNVITMAGYAATIAWLMGASKTWGVVGLVADEVDGRVARATGTATEYGSLLDWATDLTLTGAVAYKANLLWTLPPVTAFQAYLRQKQQAPSIGSARAIYTIIALLQKEETK